MRVSASFSRDEAMALERLLRLATRIPDLATVVRSDAFAGLLRKAVRLRSAAIGEAEVKRRLKGRERAERERAIVEECKAAVAAGARWSLSGAARRYRIGERRVRELTDGIRAARVLQSLTDEQLDDLAVVRCALLDARVWSGRRAMLPLLAARYNRPQHAVARGIVLVSKRPRPDGVSALNAAALLRELMSLEYAPVQEEAAQ